jgi:hypothetical protein
MNKLCGCTVYLSGPMQYAKDKGIEWRQKLIPFLKSMNMIILDPTNKPDMCNLKEDAGYVNKLNELKKLKQYKKLSKEVRKIRSVDLRMTDLANIGIFYINIQIPTFGTLEELFTMNRSKKVCLIMSEGGLNKLPLWLWGTNYFEHNFGDWKSLRNYLTNINMGTISDKSRRWWFFDFKKLSVG